MGLGTIVTEIISALDAHSGALTVLFSALLTIVTWRYVRLTKELVLLNRDPHIVFSVQPRDEWLNWIDRK